MATWRREVIIRRVEFTVPAGGHGASWAQVSQALQAAIADHHRSTGERASDDAVWVQPGDGEIVIWYEQPDGPAKHGAVQFGPRVFTTEPELWDRQDARCVVPVRDTTRAASITRVSVRVARRRRNGAPALVDVLVPGGVSVKVSGTSVNGAVGQDGYNHDQEPQILATARQGLRLPASGAAPVAAVA